MLNSIKTEQWYRNIKTQKRYKVIAIAKHSETEELMVVYGKITQNLDLDIWVRPLELFKEKFEELN